jgi:catechol 2,3-dioxygenase-like lactoylglutathione lyase family enzyme
MQLDTPIAFLATDQPVKSSMFYEEVLGLELVDDNPFALVFKVGSIVLRIQKLDDWTAVPGTVFGWEVEDIYKSIDELSSKGVTCEMYPHFDQDEHGVWTTPDYAQVAWFKDPVGNLLSLTQPK